MLCEDQPWELGRIVQSRSLPAGYVFRARLILMLAEGAFYNSIKLGLGTTAPTISRWMQLFLGDGFGRLETTHPGHKLTVLMPRLRARTPAATRRPPGERLDLRTYWSRRKLAAVLGASKDAVHRVWRQAGLKPHRLEWCMASDDRDFETKAAYTSLAIP